MKYLVIVLSLITLFYYFSYPLLKYIGVEFPLIRDIQLRFSLINCILTIIFIFSITLFKFNLPLFVRIIGLISLTIQLFILNFAAILYLYD